MIAVAVQSAPLQVDLYQTETPLTTHDLMADVSSALSGLASGPQVDLLSILNDDISPSGVGIILANGSIPSFVTLSTKRDDHEDDDECEHDDDRNRFKGSDDHDHDYEGCPPIPEASTWWAALAMLVAVKFVRTGRRS